MYTYHNYYDVFLPLKSGAAHNLLCLHIPTFLKQQYSQLW